MFKCILGVVEVVVMFVRVDQVQCIHVIEVTICFLFDIEMVGWMFEGLGEWAGIDMI